MKANLSLGQVSGIKIRVHWTFFLLMAWVIFAELTQGGNLESILFNITFVLAVFLCVVLHELGHAFMANHYNIKTEKITLLPIGGMASFEKLPGSPKQELLIAIAGPLINVIIAIILFFIVPVKDFMQLNFTETFEVLVRYNIQSFLFFLFIANVGLVVFNSIPAFPMDGGRILRALLAIKIGRVKATKIASNLGLIIAVLFFLIGLLYNPFLVFIALFIFLGAFGENLMVQQMALLDGHTVEEAMLLNITTFKPQDSIDLVVNKIISGTETNFIVVEDQTIIGILHHKTIIENSNKMVLVGEIMDVNFKTIKGTDSIKKVYQLIYNDKQELFPVMENGKLIGAIDAVNLNEYILLQSKLAF
ncbi:site-2 protease family protein [Winogradskyella thalassocola]|uniref:Zinc metalloprotease n=1 Tax=Winogradskyella thalassocola TaxID=262004 RepID=A0A1G8JGJ7_9FLAO|nr:site-2 protease family protein [Winogradskyella thalassocola]SDI29760.1 Zn-dependent protease (includes SpoIVFB) [Winogradskyella thalassocola]